MQTNDNRVNLRRRYSYDVYATRPADQPLHASRYDVRHGNRNLGWVKRLSAHAWSAHKSGFWDVRNLGEYTTRGAAVAALVDDTDLTLQAL